MDSSTLQSLVLIYAICVVAPLLADMAKRRVLIPTVVLELTLGVVAGPAVLNWVKDDGAIAGLSDLGLCLLMFLAGYEIEFSRIKGAPIAMAVRSWLVTLAIGFAIAAVVAAATGNLGPHTVALGLVLTTTAVGTLLPILRDRGEIPTPFGPYVLATGSVGEFLPIVGISLFLATERPAHTALVLLVFVAIGLGVMVLALRSRTPRVVRVIGETLDTSAQFGVRVAIFICVLLVWLATAFDLDYLLGAFAGGVALRLFLSASEAHTISVVESKLEAVSFGFLVPLFFVMSGVRLDLQAMVDEPLYFLLIPILVLVFLLVRGGPVWLLARREPAADARPLAVYASTALPLVVVITGIGVDDKTMGAPLASALVTSAMVSVLVLPFVAGNLRHSTQVVEPSDGG